MGHAVEPLAIRWLIEDGWDVVYNEGSQEAQTSFSIPVEGGSIVGHPDCWMKRGGSPFRIADIKTMKSSAFARFKRYGANSQYPQYVDQLTVYAMGASASQVVGSEERIATDAMAIVGVNKDNSTYNIEFLSFDIDRWARIKNRAEKILAMEEEPPIEVSEWACNYCPYKSRCRPPEVAIDRIKKGAMIDLDDPDLVASAEELVELEDIESDVTERIKTLKSEMKLRLEKEAVSIINVGGFTVERTLTNRSSFNQKELEKTMPEVYSRFKGTTPVETIKVKRQQ